MLLIYALRIITLFYPVADTTTERNALMATVYPRLKVYCREKHGLEFQVGVENKTHPSQWRHNGHDCVSNHQPHHCLLNRLLGRRSKETSKLRVTGLCVGNSPGTGEFPAQMASNAENVSIWWRHHDNSSQPGTMFDVYQEQPGRNSSVRNKRIWSVNNDEFPLPLLTVPNDSLSTTIALLDGSICPQLYGTWWRHQMERFSALLAICAGNSPVPAGPRGIPRTKASDEELWCFLWSAPE